MIPFVVLLPFGEHILRYLPDPFNMEKIGTLAANIIAERTKANGHSKAHVSFSIMCRVEPTNFLRSRKH